MLVKGCSVGGLVVVVEEVECRRQIRGRCQ